MSRSHRSSFLASGAQFMAGLMLLQCAIPVYAQQAEQPQPFRVVVLEGEGSINNIRHQVNRGAMVMVEDENKNPLSGVAVTFFLPSEGPSGLFPNGSRVLTVFTDQKGLAASRGVKFNNLVGLMRVKVTASLFSQTAESTITQTNISSGAAMKTSFSPSTGVAKVSGGGGMKSPGFLSSKAFWIVLAAAAGGGGAAYYFLNKKPGPAATIGIGGQPVIGAPR
ncbi:MAG: hypothetical protein NTV70_20645 [Acidobacteria bacterium]|nr:hypothetical protein [Acidobacteriota bacterium]